MENVVEKLNENLQVIYRRVVDADKALDQLQQQGKAKHSQIFADDAGFAQTSNRFQPYLEELAGNVAKLQTQSEQEAQKTLVLVVKQMESMFVTLNNLTNILSK
ncbi:MAG: hypothetical protein GJ680_13805 [Alteromonadaceae bacterium]|nr:hypothetical protein [Alteromonadaceae bacterium]